MASYFSPSAVSDRLVSGFNSKSARYGALMSQGSSRYRAALHRWGTFPAFMGIGAGVGALIGNATSDSPGKGALIGAGAGAALRFGLHAAEGYQKLAKIPLTRTFAVTGLSALAAAAWMARSNPEHVDTGYYDDAGEAQVSPGRDMVSPGRDMRDRLNTIGATGDMVFGMHRGRHG